MEQQAPTNTIVQNKTFADENQVLFEGALFGNPDEKLNKTDRYSMADEYATSIDILKTPVLAGTVSWLPASVDELHVWNIPAVFAEVKNFHQLMLQTYTFYKPTVRMQFRVNATRFHYGRLMAYFVPLNATYEANVYEATGFQHVFLDAAESNTGTLDIPFQHIQEYLTTNTGADLNVLGSVHLVVFNALHSPTGDTSPVTVEAWVSCNDVSLHLPIAPHEPAFLIPQSENCVKPFGDLAGFRDSRSSPLCLTRTANYQDDHLTVRKPEEMSMRAIAKHPMLTNRINWTTAQAANTSLLNIPVIPSYCPTGSSTTNYTAEFPTYLAFVAQHYAYWRGSIKYIFDVVCSDMHNGRLAVFFHPNQVSGVPNDFPLKSNEPMAVFDITKTQRRFEVTIPYVSATPRKVWMAWNSTNSRNDLTDDMILGDIQLMVAGQLKSPPNLDDTVYVNMFMAGGDDIEFEFPTRRPEILTATPELLSLGEARSTDYGEIPTSPTPLTTITPIATTRTRDWPLVVTMMNPQSEVTPIGSKQMPPSTFITKGGRNVVADDPFHEDTDSISNLVGRFGHVQTCLDEVKQVELIGLQVRQNPDPATQPSQAVYLGRTERALVVTPFMAARNFPVNAQIPGTVGNGFVGNVDYNFMSSLANIFIFWKGSLKYKIQPHAGRQNPIMLSAAYDPVAKFFTDVNDNRADLAPTIVNPFSMSLNGRYNYLPKVTTNCAQNASLEFSTPFYSHYAKLTCEAALEVAQPSRPSSADMGRLYIYSWAHPGAYQSFPMQIGDSGEPLNGLKMADISTFVYDLYQAGGEDFQFSYLRPPRRQYLMTRPFDETLP